MRPLGKPSGLFISLCPRQTLREDTAPGTFDVKTLPGAGLQFTHHSHAREKSCEALTPTAFPPNINLRVTTYV
jgi:hypothetical protein